MYFFGLEIQLQMADETSIVNLLRHTRIHQSLLFKIVFAIQFNKY